MEAPLVGTIHRGRFRTARAQRQLLPIITLFIPGIPLKTTHLQKRA